MIQAKKSPAIIAGIGMMLLIFDSKHALEGAKIGLDLCVRMVIPSLLPFFVISMMFTTSINNHDSFIIRQLSRTMHIPKTAASVLIPAFLGGYPVGAKCAADLYYNRILEKEEAERIRKEAARAEAAKKAEEEQAEKVRKAREALAERKNKK